MGAGPTARAQPVPATLGDSRQDPCTQGQGTHSHPSLNRYIFFCLYDRKKENEVFLVPPRHLKRCLVFNRPTSISSNRQLIHTHARIYSFLTVRFAFVFIYLPNVPAALGSAVREGQGRDPAEAPPEPRKPPPPPPPPPRIPAARCAPPAMPATPPRRGDTPLRLVPSPRRSPGDESPPPAPTCRLQPPRRREERRSGGGRCALSPRGRWLPRPRGWALQRGFRGGAGEQLRAHLRARRRSGPHRISPGTRPPTQPPSVAHCGGRRPVPLSLCLPGARRAPRGAAPSLGLRRRRAAA